MCAPANLASTSTQSVPTCEQQQQQRPRLRRRPSPISVAATGTDDLTSISSNSAASSTKKTRKSSKPKGGVTFGSSVAVRLIPTHHELTPKQYDATYYTPADLENSRNEGLDDIRSLRSEEPEASAENDFNGPCYRGIEHLVTRQAKLDRTERRRAYVDAVLIEQYQQVTSNGYANVNDLAAIARTKSHNDKAVARSKGVADENVMKDIVGKKVMQKARALSTAGKGEDGSQRKLAFITGAVRSVRIGSVRREDYAAMENACSA